MTLAVIAEQAATRPSPGPKCPRCQREMHYKDVNANTGESRVGSLPLERGYYWLRPVMEQDPTLTEAC